MPPQNMLFYQHNEETLLNKSTTLQNVSTEVSVKCSLTTFHSCFAAKASNNILWFGALSAGKDHGFGLILKTIQ